MTISQIRVFRNVIMVPSPHFTEDSNTNCKMVCQSALNYDKCSSVGFCPFPIFYIWMESSLFDLIVGNVKSYLQIDFAYTFCH